jgi:NAD(P)-dependent dehydrogenase (short-subunit alcohol dehydrogenase family)
VWVAVSAPDPSRRSVLITGASRGIGRATAEAFAGAGWCVIGAVRDPDSVEPFPGRAVALVPLDLSDAAQIAPAVERAQEIAGGPLGCVVNNAGWALFGAVDDVGLELARAQFEINLFGALAVLQAALPAMRRAGRGTVVAVSTLSGRIPVPLFSMYSASKLALAATCEALSLELASEGIRAIVVEAGVVRTEFAHATRISGSAGAPAGTHAQTRERVLGALRGAREEHGIPPARVAEAILGAAGDPGGPDRVVIADKFLGPLADALLPPGDALGRAHRHFGLAGRYPVAEVSPP